jgi:hypothetical protein
MPISITKPVIGGSENSWGQEINTALDSIVTAVNANETASGSNLTSGSVSPTFDVLTANSVAFGPWTITATGGSLYFATGGNNKMKLDTNGNLIVTGDVTGFGTIT